MDFDIPADIQETLVRLDDFIERIPKFKNELIIAGHFSTRYHTHEIRRTLAEKVPPELACKLKVWV